VDDIMLAQKIALEPDEQAAALGMQDVADPTMADEAKRNARPRDGCRFNNAARRAGLPRAPEGPE
jgi:hypothetical protein